MIVSLSRHGSWILHHLMSLDDHSRHEVGREDILQNWKWFLTKFTKWHYHSLTVKRTDWWKSQPHIIIVYNLKIQTWSVSLIIFGQQIFSDFLNASFTQPHAPFRSRLGSFWFQIVSIKVWSTKRPCFIKFHWKFCWYMEAASAFPHGYINTYDTQSSGKSSPLGV